jgi:hypothetical protein
MLGLARRGFRTLGLGAVALSGLVACSSGSGGASEEAAPEAAPPVDVDAPAEGAADAPGRYQFVETPGGMTVESIRADGVQTLTCPTRSCLGLCDECAAAACRAAGELEAVCSGLVRSCTEACNCDSGGQRCGFPVCAYDRQLCYIGDDVPESELPGVDPNDPLPDPAPEAGLPSGSSGSGASQPTPVP